MTIIYEVKIIGTAELALNPQLVARIENIYEVSGFGDKKKYFTDLFINGYVKFVAILYKNGTASGAATINILKKNILIFENACVIQPSNGDFANFMRELIDELVYGNCRLYPLLQGLSSVNVTNYYIMCFVDKDNQYLKRINSKCYIDKNNGCHPFSFLTKKKGFDSKLFPNLKFEWVDEEAFVVRIRDGNIIPRPGECVPVLVDTEEVPNVTNNNDVVSNPSDTPMQLSSMPSSNSRLNKRKKSE